MVDIDTRLFRSFLAVAAEHSFSRGARRLGFSQATMSLRIRVLEEKLGVRLLDRGPRNVQLTAAGRSLLPDVQALVDAHDKMLRRLRAVPAVAKVRLGIAEGHVASLLPRLMKDVQDDRSGVQLEILCRTNGCLQRMVESCRLDLAILSMPGSSAVGLDLRSLQLHWVASPGFAPVAEVPLPVAWHEDDCFFRLSGTAALKSAGVAYREVLLGSDERIVQSAVEAGTAVTVMAEGTVPPALEVFPPNLGLPALEKAAIRLLESPSAQSEAIRTVKQRILNAYRGAEAMAA